MNSNQKGKRGEREFASLCRSEGYNSVRRSKQYCGEVGDADLINLPGIHVEVKRVERLNIDQAMSQAINDARDTDNMPIVAHRKNNCYWLITMEAEDWFNLYREWEAGR